MSRFNTHFIDRSSWLRDSEEALARAQIGSSGRVLLRWQRRFVVTSERELLMPLSEVSSIALRDAELVYLGRYRDLDCFAADLRDEPVLDKVEFSELRALGLALDDEQRALAFYAQGVLNWHARHGFCANCGSATRMQQAGHARRCSNPDCAKVHYPKIDPAVIFSIENATGPEPRILLGRKAEWEAGRRSVIAGFVEPGETLEDAVRREAMEETGVKVDAVRYVASQPWPFPDALMCAFECRTEQSVITLNDQELEAASWITPGQLAAGIRAGELSMPYRASIAWYLVDAWYRRHTGQSLDSI